VSNFFPNFSACNLLTFRPELDLPEYENYEALKKALVTACEMGGNYFGFA
jgi:hypothetical protein